MHVLAVIPARGGSKRIPRKNLVDFDGKPLVAHSIAHAQAATTVTRTLVSTDDAEIRAVALAHGAEAPFVRPPELAEDHVLDWPVFMHALKFLQDSEGYRPDLVVHLRPTAPLRRPEWIDEAVRSLLADPRADSIRSVSPPAAHPYRVFRVGSDGYLVPVMIHEHPEPYLLRRQDWPPMHFYNAVLDVTRPATIFDKQSMTGDHILPFYMNADDVSDIDSPHDLEIARIRAELFR